MAQLKYYDNEEQEWKALETSGNHIRFSYGEYSGKSLPQVLNELKNVMAGGAITQNTFEFHTLNINMDGQRKITLPIKIDTSKHAFLLFLNLGILSTDSYELNETGYSITFNKDLNMSDALYLVVFKTIKTTPPDTYDGIIISEGSIHESKLTPTLQEKINGALHSSEKGVSLATLIDGKVPADQLPKLNNEEVLEHIQYKNNENRLEFENAKISGDLIVQEYNVLESIKSAQEKPSSNSKSITVSETEPDNPNENDIWIVI